MYEDELKRFLTNVNEHELTINLDNGLYRDLTIKKEDTVSYHYNITTRPGYLMISGDMGTYVFSRIPDMFKFFRNDGYEINAGYWAEKLVADSEFAKSEVFSPKRVEQYLNQIMEDYIEDNWDEDVGEERELIESLITQANMCEDDFFYSIEKNANSTKLDLSDYYEYDFKDYSYYYIWCCYAIVHAIKLYDKIKKVSV